MAKYCVIDSATNIVVNLTEWDGVSDWTPPEGTFVEPAENSGIGWSWTGTGYTPPIDTGPTAEDNKATAIQLLSETDWVNEPDVINPNNNPHLTNKSDFDNYRVAVRQYAVYPVSGYINWPVKPTEQWAS